MNLKEFLYNEPFTFKTNEDSQFLILPRTIQSDLLNFDELKNVYTQFQSLMHPYFISTVTLSSCLD